MARAMGRLAAWALAGACVATAVVAAPGAVTVPSGGTPLAEAWADTLHVSAPRVTLDDIIADIGNRQRADRDSLRSVAFTAVVTTVRTPAGVSGGAADSAGTWEVEENALRYHQDRGRPDRVVRLWQRKQKVKDGVAEPEKVTPTGEPRWQPRPSDMVNDLPFAAGGAAKYRYELIEKKLLGGSLVYAVAFAPRDAFAALPSGVIWVDMADWAIRRVEARFDDAVPYPWLVRAVPRYRLRQAPCGDVWFPVLETARVDLRHLPLTGAGGSYDIRVELRDIVINGEPCDCEDTDTTGDDATAAFWSGIDDAWAAEMSAPLRAPVSLAPAQLDSLSREGARMLAALPELPPWRLRWRPMLPVFNRSQGFVPRAQVVLGRTGGGTRVEADLGPGLDDRRLTWGLGASTRLHETLTLRAGGGRTTGAFAGDGRDRWRSWSALLWGSDPNHYFDRTAWQAGAAWRPAAAFQLYTEFSTARELPLAVHSRWNALGRGLSPDGMRAADALDARSAQVGVGVRVGIATLKAGVSRHRVQARVLAGDDGIDRERDLTEWRWSALLRHQDGAGHRWTLNTGGRGLDGPAPAQWRVWLGDYQPAEFAANEAGAGSLCGWPAATLVGDRGLWASLTADLDVDLWRALKVPVLRDLRLQPLLFAEWAGAWGTAGSSWFAGPVDGFATPVTGSRADVGFGFTRRVDLPLMGVGSRLELRAARAVGEGAADQDWRFVVGVGR